MSTKNTYLKRTLSNELARLSEDFAVIVVTGPRQSGKTTLCRNQFANFHYINLENISAREQIQTAPKAFLEQHLEGLIIDEAQHLPELFSYIQLIVDENKEAQFILTGSSDFSLMQGITQSLAGRVAVLTLLPLSLKELSDSISRIETNTLLFNGGYPAVWGKNIPVQDVARNYYNTYIERDVRQLLNVKNITKYQTFIKLCAGRIGTELNASALSNAIGVSVPTVQEWLSTLEASYILFRLPPFFRNIGKRLVKSPKLYFYDTGLVCFLLGIENEKQLETHPLRGAIFENMVVLEFFKHRYNQGKEPHFYFYRDKSQIEVDLIEEKGVDLYAYEIKSAKAFTKSFMASLDYFRKVAGTNVVSTQVIYDGKNDIFSSENGMINFRNLKF
ncbi:ATP-binding protein [Aequorivita capsosiphonis]|uniref:ATP-binding protein n=1 Tax=Aequorivita capsosiphonis TaxID=487317 RepID=UPI00047DEC94|nr:ATP-binding protein [Aequorivita capsosiphonis]